MLAQVLAAIIALGSVTFYMAAFFFPEVHRQRDFVWSGVGFFYALVLWLCAGRLTGGVLLGQVASVSLIVWLGSQTLLLRRQQAAPEDKTAIAPEVKESVQGFTFGKLLSPLTRRFQRPTAPPTTPPETVATLVDEEVPDTEAPKAETPAHDHETPAAAPADPAADLNSAAAPTAEPEAAAPPTAESPAGEPEAAEPPVETPPEPEPEVAAMAVSHWPEEEASNWPEEAEPAASNWVDTEASNWPEETAAAAEPAAANWVDEPEPEAIDVPATPAEVRIDSAEPVDPESEMADIPEGEAISSLDQLSLEGPPPAGEPTPTDDWEKPGESGW